MLNLHFYQFRIDVKRSNLPLISLRPFHFKRIHFIDLRLHNLRNFANHCGLTLSVIKIPLDKSTGESNKSAN